jgi:pimeloyl-ACP methyl ester carboxylesterase
LTKQPRLEVVTRSPPRESANPHPIVFVHGAFAAAWCWDDHFAPYFSERGYRSYALSLRGHGRSAGREALAISSISDYVADLGAVVFGLDALPIMIGHSMGGHIVERYLSEHSAAAAVLMSSIPEYGLLPEAFSLVLKDFALFQQINLALYRDRGLLNWEYLRRALFSDDLPAPMVARHLARLQQESERAIFDMSWPGLARLNGAIPLLVLGAENDLLFPSSAAHGLARRHRGEVDIVPRMTHAMMLDTRWRVAADRILQWLAGIGL